MKRMKCCNSTQMLQRINIVKVQTQKGICGTVLTVQWMPSGEHKNYDHILTSNSTNTKHSGELFSCSYAYIICFQVEIKQRGILSKDFDSLPKLQIAFNVCTWSWSRHLWSRTQHCWRYQTSWLLFEMHNVGGVINLISQNKMKNSWELRNSCIELWQYWQAYFVW